MILNLPPDKTGIYMILMALADPKVMKLLEESAGHLGVGDQCIFNFPTCNTKECAYMSQAMHAKTGPLTTPSLMPYLYLCAYEIRWPCELQQQGNPNLPHWLAGNPRSV